MHMVGLLNTPWAIILPGLVNPFGVYLMRIVWDQGFENDLIEAARLDGASETRIFFRIGLPLVATGLTLYWCGETPYRDLNFFRKVS
jgi:multiple sugar transport system permease protein